MRNLPGSNSACGEALGLTWISVWNTVNICTGSLWGILWGSTHMCVTLRLSGPLWASLGFSQQPASPPASQPPKRRTGSLVVIPPASQPASSLVVILLVGRLPGRNSASGEPPWSKFCLWRASLVVCNSACGEALGFKWIYVWNPMYVRGRA